MKINLQRLEIHLSSRATVYMMYIYMIPRVVFLFLPFHNLVVPYTLRSMVQFYKTIFFIPNIIFYSTIFNFMQLITDKTASQHIYIFFKFGYIKPESRFGDQENHTFTHHFYMCIYYACAKKKTKRKNRVRSLLFKKWHSIVQPSPSISNYISKTK